MHKASLPSYLGDLADCPGANLALLRGSMLQGAAWDGFGLVWMHPVERHVWSSLGVLPRPQSCCHSQPNASGARPCVWHALRGAGRTLASLCAQELLQQFRLFGRVVVCPGATSVADICHPPCSSWWVSLPFPCGFFSSWLHQLTAVRGVIPCLLSTFCTAREGPCSGEISIALPQLAVREAAHGGAAGPGPPSRDERGFPRTPQLSAARSLLVLSYKVMVLLPPAPCSAPSLSGMFTPCEQPRALLPCAFLPSLAWAMPVVFFIFSQAGCCYAS